MEDIDFSVLKKGGFMKQVQKERFSMRLKVVGGQLTVSQLAKIQDIAQNYGQGYIHLTARQSVEIPFIHKSDIAAVKNELAAAGLQPGVCGPRVRTVTACQGKAICTHGLIDTTILAQEIDRRYGGRELPHKFKLGITGCRNNCLKAEENDIGVKGGVMPDWQEDKCSFCGLCEAICPSHAITVDKENRKLLFDQVGCVFCGRCLKACPAEAWSGTSGVLVFFGGLFGNRISIGKQLMPVLLSEEQLHAVIEATLAFFQKHGKASERFAATLDRVGWELLKNDLEGLT